MSRIRCCTASACCYKPRTKKPKGASLVESQLAATHRPLALSLQGTLSSKKKKQAKLKRVMGALRKNARKERGTGAESFAAVQLLNDPQVRYLLPCGWGDRMLLQCSC